MKKEWMYFIAGAGLIGAIMFFTMSADYETYNECMAKEMQKMPSASDRAVVAIVVLVCEERFPPPEELSLPKELYLPEKRPPAPLSGASENVSTLLTEDQLKRLDARVREKRPPAPLTEDQLKRLDALVPE